MKGPLFIDTGAFYARYVARDAHHKEAVSLWKRVLDESLSCVTTNFVICELVTLLVYRFGAARALLAAREIYASHAVQILSIVLEQELKAIEWMEKFADQDFSMTDAVSFAVMAEKGIGIAFTFDRHFEIAGFERFQ